MDKALREQRVYYCRVVHTAKGCRESKKKLRRSDDIIPMKDLKLAESYMWTFATEMQLDSTEMGRKQDKLCV